MAIERAHVAVHLKPWGVTDLRPWSQAGGNGARIGELSFERTDRAAPATSLLLKLLFTSEPLSIQVHPDDAYARSIGLPNGKNEAWVRSGCRSRRQGGTGSHRATFRRATAQCHYRWLDREPRGLEDG